MRQLKLILTFVGIAALAAGTSASAQEDGLVGPPPTPEDVARDVTLTEGALVRARDIRSLSCVGHDGRTDLSSGFNCHWEQRHGREWNQRQGSFFEDLMSGMRLYARPEEQDWWPSEEQLAAALSHHRGVVIDPAAIDDISCRSIAEEPTEFDCQWLQDGESERWNEERWHANLAGDGADWILIDDPYQRFVPTRLDRVDPFYMNGETLLLRGLLRCPGGFHCAIVGNGTGLGIAYVEQIEGELNRLSGQRVYLKAVVTDICTVNICTDRAPFIIPVEVSVQPFRH